MSRYLHIVCLDSPWPPDYGGAIDMMNRIKALHGLGIRIHLHYFRYNERKNSQQLFNYCETVKSYERKTGWKGFSFTTPYIVSSRINQELITDLQKDDHPVLLEGIHCTGILPGFDKRRIVVRMHNDEAVYYKQLAGATPDLFKKIYFNYESRLLKKYCKRLPDNCLYACISELDEISFRQKYRLEQTKFLPAFTSWQEVNCQEGLGEYCLYHGNLSVPENEQAAIWLVEKVFDQLKFPLIIAGKNPSTRLMSIAGKKNQQITIISDPSENELNDLIVNAQVNVLPSLNRFPTGIKLKLLHALFTGRHCIVDRPMITGSGLEQACHIAKNAEAFSSIIAQLFRQPFTNEEIVLRKKLLGDRYDNKKNAEQLIKWLY